MLLFLLLLNSFGSSLEFSFVIAFLFLLKSRRDFINQIELCMFKNSSKWVQIYDKLPTPKA